MATVSYELKITEAYHVFDKTIAIYRNAVHYISAIEVRHYDELKSLDNITGDDGKVIISAQQNGNYKTLRLWRLANNYNEAIAVETAVEIVRFALESKADVIAFEHLNMKKKKRGNKQKLSLWKKRDIQHRVEALAARNGIRVSYICAVNTSRLAYDGSGKVIRGKDAGFNTYELCKFTTGKVYNCDLSASKNIGARFFIRILLKSLSAKEELLVLAKVPELNRRTSCCLATLISAYAVLRTFKAKPEAPAKGDAA